MRDEIVRDLGGPLRPAARWATRIQLLPGEMARALSGAPPRLRLGPLRHARHRPRSDKDKMHAQHAPQLRLLRCAGRADLLHRPRPGARLLARLRHVPAVDHGRGAAFGLETCPQAAFADLPRRAAASARHPAEQKIVCGMSLGYPDPEAKVNAFTPDRMRARRVCDVCRQLAAIAAPPQHRCRTHELAGRPEAERTLQQKRNGRAGCGEHRPAKRAQRTRRGFI